MNARTHDIRAPHSQPSSSSTTGVGATRPASPTPRTTWLGTSLSFFFPRPSPRLHRLQLRPCCARYPKLPTVLLLRSTLVISTLPFKRPTPRLASPRSATAFPSCSSRLATPTTSTARWLPPSGATSGPTGPLDIHLVRVETTTLPLSLRPRFQQCHFHAGYPPAQGIRPGRVRSTVRSLRVVLHSAFPPPLQRFPVPAPSLVVGRHSLFCPLATPHAARQSRQPTNGVHLDTTSHLSHHRLPR